MTLDLIENGLRNARYEMDEVLFRTALSPGIREQHDEFPLIGDPEGKMVVGQFGLSIPDFLDGFDGTIEEGDVLLTSDPYACGAAISHANDWLVVVPIFYEGRVVGWSSMFGHMSDVGGKTPSSMPTDAQTIFEEGVVIPPFKLYTKGVLNDDALRIILNQVRKPDWNRADLNGLVAACRTAVAPGASRCATGSAPPPTSRRSTRCCERNYDAMKVLLAMVFEEGRTLSFTDYICDDGVGYGPYELKLSLTRTGDKVHLDFTGSSPQAQGPINYYINENLARMFFGIYMITVADPQILWNDGFYPLVDVDDPRRLVLEAEVPGRAQRGRNHGIGRVFDLFGGLLGQTNPALLNAAGLLLLAALHVLRATTRTGRPQGRVVPAVLDRLRRHPRPAARRRARTATRCGRRFVNIPCEYLESYYPLRIEKWETVADTGGAGLHRGGNGVDVAYRLPGAGHDRHPRRPLAHLPVGRQRRRAGRPRHASGSSAPTAPARCCPASATTCRSTPGDVLHFVTWGGGGWGDPLERDPELVGAGGAPRAGDRRGRARGTASRGRRRAASTPTATEHAARPDARRPARPSCRSSTWARRSRSCWRAARRRPACPRRSGPVWV